MSESKVFPQESDMLALSGEVERAVEAACSASIDKWGRVIAASTAAAVAVEKAFQKVLDTAIKVGVGKSQGACKALATLVIEHPGFKDRVDSNDTRAAKEWARVRRQWGVCLIRAHYHGVPFSLDLAGDKESALPWEESKKKPAKEGKSIADLIRDGAPTIGKSADLAVLLAFAIKSCRASGLPNLAADLLDCVQDAIPTFAE